MTPDPTLVYPYSTIQYTGPTAGWLRSDVAGRDPGDEHVMLPSSLDRRTNVERASEPSDEHRDTVNPGMLKVPDARKAAAAAIAYETQSRVAVELQALLAANVRAEEQERAMDRDPMLVMNPGILKTPPVMFPSSLDRRTNVERASEPGKKYDAGKPPVSLLPREALEAMARVLDFGATKYGRHNWRAGMSWSRVVDAAMRHLIAFADGEDRDPETGESHAAHAAVCCAFLITYAAKRIGKDDRTPPSGGDGNTFQVTGTTTIEYPRGGTVRLEARDE